MKVTVELDLSIIARASYKDGRVQMKVTGAMPLGDGLDRTASQSITGASEEVEALFKQAFEALLEEQQEKVVRVTRVAASEALAVAARKGEM
ncbi:MAG TPA: hypothetical protein VEC96_05080 [Anaerolineae bacterium]|nr:hypothetical protein [Anaerolineae bacterium]